MNKSQCNLFQIPELNTAALPVLLLEDIYPSSVRQQGNQKMLDAHVCSGTKDHILYFHLLLSATAAALRMQKKKKKETNQKRLKKWSDSKVNV